MPLLGDYRARRCRTFGRAMCGQADLRGAASGIPTAPKTMCNFCPGQLSMVSITDARVLIGYQHLRFTVDTSRCPKGIEDLFSDPIRPQASLSMSLPNSGDEMGVTPTCTTQNSSREF